MNLFAHTVDGEETILDRIIHPLTGIDHLLAIALVAIAGAMLMIARRGRTAVDTEGGTTRVRSRMLMTGSAIALVGAVALLLLV